MTSGPQWSTACPDWERRIVNRQSLIPFQPLFQDQADAALGVFNSLTIADVAGSPTMGEVCRPWLLDYVAAIFGAYDEFGIHDGSKGRQLISESLLFLSKKNAKSTTAAGIMLTALILNWRQSAEFLILAPTIEIANNSFYPARDMVRSNETLSSLLHVQEHLRTIVHLNSNSTLKVVAADNEAVSGKKATGVLIDELWLFGKKAGAENMLREATGGLASRPEGFTLYLSTQSDEPPAGVFKQKLDYARAVRDGKIIDNRFLPVLYEFPQAMIESGDARRPENFYVTNPNLGASVDEQYLIREHRKAELSGEESMRGFLAKHLNIEIGLNLRSDRWAGADFWEAAGDTAMTLDSLLQRSEVAVAGIDGGGLDDLLGLFVIGRDRLTRKLLGWSHAWAHRIVLDRRKEIAPLLLDFEKQGDLTIVDLPGRDITEVGDIVHKIRETGLLPDKLAIGVDSAGIGAVVEELQGRGITQDQLVAISQGWKLNGAIKTTERWIAGGELIHCGQPLMGWAVSNCKVEQKGNAITITKQASGTAKIDTAMAMFDAASLMALNPKARGRLQMFTLGGRNG